MPLRTIASWIVALLLCASAQAQVPGPQVRFAPIGAEYDHGSGLLKLDRLYDDRGSVWLGGAPPFDMFPIDEIDVNLTVSIGPGGQLIDGIMTIDGTIPSSDPTKPLLTGLLTSLNLVWTTCYDTPGVCTIFNFYFDFDTLESQVPGFPDQGYWVSAHAGSYDGIRSITNQNLFTESFSITPRSFQTAIYPRLPEPAGAAFLVLAAFLLRHRRKGEAGKSTANCYPEVVRCGVSR